VEVMCRVGLAVPGDFHARHYHPTALAGTFGAAAAAGKQYSPAALCSRTTTERADTRESV
jgi:hypothetical protein